MTDSTKQNSIQSPRSSVAALTALVVVGGTASAQTGAPASKEAAVILPEVSVQSQRNREVASPKFTAPLSDTPQSISVIPSQVFEQQGARNLTDILRNSPGITFNAGENGFGTNTSNFSLRGFDTSGSVYVDGSRDSGNYFRDAFNIEQVEVVKGPAGDNGRGGAGGYVNIATKSPRAEDFGSATASYGFDEHASIDRMRATVDVNRSLGGFLNGSAFRLNALWQDGGVAGRDYAEKNNWGVAPSFVFGLGTPTRVSLSYQHLQQNDRPEWGVPGAFIPGMINYDTSARGEANRARFYGHTSDYDDVTSDSALARIEHDLSPTMRLSNQTRWSKTDREALYAAPTGYTPATRLVTTQRQAYSRENTAISNLTNLAAAFETGSLRHAFSAGIELSREESSANRYVTNGVLGNPGSVSVDSPDVNRALTGLVGLVPLQTSAVDIKTAAAYAYDTIQVNPQWQLTGGLRVERYSVDIDSNTAAGAPQGPDGFDRSETTVSGKFGVTHKPTKEGSIYAAIGVAALPPGSFLSNPDISRDGDNAFPGWIAGQNSAKSKVQRSINYEVGTKWSFAGDRLSTTAALFRTERENIAMAGTVGGIANTFSGNAEQVVQGLEFGATGQITREWSIFGGVLFMESERKHGAEVDAARRAANAADYGMRTSTNGDELAFSPKFTASLWTTYRFPIGLTVGGGFQHVGESFLGRPDDAERIIPNGNAGKLPSYTVYNAVVSYPVNKSVTLRLNVDNIADKFYAASSNWNGTRVFLGASRSFLLSADYRF